MNTTGLLKYAGALSALAIFAACGGGSAVPPSAAPLAAGYVGRTLSLNGTLVTAARANPNPLPVYAPALPNRLNRLKKYEYIISDYDSYASIFDYPKSDKQLGAIDYVGGQGCTNVLYGYGNKTFWIVAGDTDITEYSAPDTPIRSLSEAIGGPSSCAMDTSGDLAVGILDGSGAGDVVIYKNATGSGTIFTTQLAREYFDGYDNDGNLFADGFNSSYSFELIELPKGSSTFRPITTSNTVKFPGSVQWDGQYLTVVDQVANAIYQYTVSGTTATLKGTVSLTGSSDCAQTWIVPDFVYCADAGNNDGEVFDYPGGGPIVATFTGDFNIPLGVTAARK